MIHPTQHAADSDFAHGVIFPEDIPFYPNTKTRSIQKHIVTTIYCPNVHTTVVYL